MKEQKILQPTTELRVFMSSHHISTVFLLLKIDNDALLQMDGFGWRLMKEVLQLRKV